MIKEKKPMFKLDQAVRDASQNVLVDPHSGVRPPGHIEAGTPVASPKLLRIAEVEALVRMSRWTIYRAIKRGEFPSQAKMGGTSVWDEDEIHECIAEQMAKRPGVKEKT